MRLNPDPSEQAQEVILSRKVNKEPHPPLIYNNNIVYYAMSQKHLGIIFDIRLSFGEHLKLVSSKINKTIGLLRKFDYGDLICEQGYNSSFHQKIECVQNNAYLEITG